ncbi:MFS general substrate transporter [Ramaria rubella]|nr:MFS general substrate transporter [Ramaria rubella]
MRYLSFAAYSQPLEMSTNDKKHELEGKFERDEKHQAGVQVDMKQIDEAANFNLNRELTHEEGLRIRKKIDKHILPMMCVLYWVQFMDKTTLGSSAILGIRTDTHLNANECNWLGTIFYLSYLLFEYPQNMALQRFPVGKWMSLNIFVWAVALCMHAACTNFGGLFTVRFIMGMCEGSITAGFLIVTAMFYTRDEQSQRVGYWFLMNGTAQIITGFLSFGVLHISHSALHPWQWFMLITGIFTLALAVCFWFLFPDSPTNAWFLTREERMLAVERIKVNQTGIGNKHFKMEQVIETLQDPKTWLFTLSVCLSSIPNSVCDGVVMMDSCTNYPQLTNQKQIIVSSFGFTYLQTTLLGCVDGVIEIITVWVGVTLVARYKNSRAYIAMLNFAPMILGAILVNTLPWGDRVGLLCGMWLNGFGTANFVITLAWVTSVTAGHTKRITVNAIILVGYCVGNIVGPQMWQASFAPRDRVPWIIITLTHIICPTLLYCVRVILSNENKRRDMEAENRSNDSDDMYVTEILADGTNLERKVDKSFLDLTDKENKDFRYVL